MNVKILMDPDVELDDERVKSGTVRASGKEDGACGEIEVRANREQRANGILHEFEHEAVFQAALNVAGENHNLPCRELVGIARLCDALRKPYQQKFVHLLTYGSRPCRNEAVRRDVGCQLVERLQHFHAGVEGLAHGQSGIGLKCNMCVILKSVKEPVRVSAPYTFSSYVPYSTPFATTMVQPFGLA